MPIVPSCGGGLDFRQGIEGSSSMELAEHDARELRHVDTHHSEPVHQVRGQSVLVQTSAKGPPVSVVGQLMILHNAATGTQNAITVARGAMSGRFAGAIPSWHNTLVRVSLYIGHRRADQG